MTFNYNLVKKYFNDKQITIRKCNSGLNEETGLFNSVSYKSIDIDCDIQPIDTQKDFDDNGKLIDAQYKLFCDNNSFINIHCEVIYKNTVYNITKITDWDNYLIIYIKAVE